MSKIIKEHPGKRFQALDEKSGSTFWVQGEYSIGQEVDQKEEVDAGESKKEEPKAEPILPKKHK